MDEKTLKSMQKKNLLSRMQRRLTDRNYRALERAAKADWYAPCLCGSGRPNGQCCRKREKP